MWVIKKTTSWFTHMPSFSSFFYLVWIIWSLNKAETHHWMATWVRKQWFTTWEKTRGEIRGVLLGPRHRAAKSSTSCEHQWQWCKPHPGQCKHTRGVRVISRYPPTVANTQTEHRRTPPANKMSPTAVPPPAVILKDKGESLVRSHIA